MQGLLCGALITFAAPAALLLCVLGAPAIAAVLADAEPAKPTARAVIVAMVGPALSPLWHLWLAGGTLDAAVQIAGDRQTICLVWGACACAWALCQVLPVVLQTMGEVRERAKARALQARLEAQAADWD